MVNKKIKYIIKIATISFLLSCTLVGNYKVLATNYDYNINQEYIKSFGGNKVDRFNELDSTTDGGIIAVGSFKSTDIDGIINKGGRDAIIVKYDKDGNQQWIKSFGGNSDDWFNSVIQTSDNGFVVAGGTSSTDIEGVNNASAKLSDAIIVKYDQNGNQQWIKSFGGNDEEWFNSVIQTSDNGFVVAGRTYSTDIEGVNNASTDLSDAFVVKYDQNGNQQWIKSFGGNDWDGFYSISQVNDGGFVVAGETYSTDIEGVNNTSTDLSDAFVVKYDQNGNQQWIKSFGGNDWDGCYSIAQVNDGGFVVAGQTYSTDIEGVNNTSTDVSDAFVVKYDQNGNQQWIKSFGGNDEEWFNSVIQTSDNGFVVVGETYSTDIEGVNNTSTDLSDAFVVKYDQNGNQQWIKSFGGNDWDGFYSIAQVNEGGFVVAGETYSTDIEGVNNTSTDLSDAFIVKYTETKTIIPEETSTNLNIEIVSDNSLEISISTNKISFEGYNGVEDLTNDKLSLTVSSSLYYDLYATLDSEIRGTNDTNAIIDKANLKIKTSDDIDYKSFTNIGEKVNLVANHKNGKDILHNINLKLLKDSSVKADTYNTNITFEVIQK